MAIESVESQTSITDRTPVLAKGRGKSGMLLHKGALITPMCTPIDATGFWACQAWGLAPARRVSNNRAFFCVSRLRMPLVPSALVHTRHISTTGSPSSVYQHDHGSVSRVFPVQSSPEEKAASDDGDML